MVLQKLFVSIHLMVLLLPFSFEVAGNLLDSKSNNWSMIVLQSRLSEPMSKELVWKTFKILIDQYKIENDLQATEAERELFQAWTDKQQEKAMQKWRQNLAELELLKSQRTLTEREQKFLDTINSLLKSEKSQPDIDSLVSKMSVDEKTSYQQMKNTMFDGFIESWKVNKALFEQYGGRVKFQQAGLEPIDAWLKFMQEQHKVGNFQIADKQQEDKFWHIFSDYINGGSVSTDVGDYFDLPMWKR